MRETPLPFKVLNIYKRKERFRIPQLSLLLLFSVINVSGFEFIDRLVGCTSAKLQLIGGEAI
jgi:hypothetical protein